MSDQNATADAARGMSAIRLIDSHCHIHDSEFYDESARQEAYRQAISAGIAMICVGTDIRSSCQAVQFAMAHNNVWAAVGIHPHEAQQEGSEGLMAIRQLLAQHSTDVSGRPVIIGVGEIGLDYFYNNSPRQVQIDSLQAQLRLAQEFALPVIFHVRDDKAGSGAVWQDFWSVFDQAASQISIQGVLHSFSDRPEQLKQGLSRGLYIGINGISTFTKDSVQQHMYAGVPLDKTLLETDAPFLTPVPFRGKVNVPAYVEEVAHDQAAKRSLPVTTVATATTANTRRLFCI